ncbi:tyrosine-type recombinase/integrase [Pseudactinotalea sp. HY158]|uniref:tyrosine-type recombinase/integrase n=1 Tax=Pseudactinotalea sp. HY158 TaxID=2654547 RepID=UPI00129C92C3|nr:tyrosine-type recombinase/integrase [Pseudactinotalea sp. HY158]QGH69783.1 tyrosine-type recombinase/integrase [Pseudactinotalea sp. HY158]QGH70384.1 tyrosine-type recombinase/integrase [Pseudactinotalea sp. HY158]
MNTVLEDLPRLIGDYLRVRRALGYKLDGVEHTLNHFVAYLHVRGARTVTIEHAVGFATAPPARTPRTQALRLSAIRCFARWAHCQNPDIEVPPARLLPARPTRVAPFIYTAAQVQAMLDAAGTLTPELRAATYQTLIGLMAATGIRTGEAIALDIASFDQRGRTLTVVGKYGKVRMLPLHPTVAAALTAYLQQRDRLLPASTCTALLISTVGTRLHPSGVHPTFRKLTDKAGLGPVSSSCRPRLHDLRHTFAVNTMLDAYRAGADPAAVLPVLATWLGHTEPRDTYWYLTGTTELLATATERLDASAAPSGRDRGDRS